jgi:hypothetical protein
LEMRVRAVSPIAWPLLLAYPIPNTPSSFKKKKYPSSIFIDLRTKKIFGTLVDFDRLAAHSICWYVKLSSHHTRNRISLANSRVLVF